VIETLQNIAAITCMLALGAIAVIAVASCIAIGVGDLIIKQFEGVEE
jgi:hypothetical protein